MATSNVEILLPVMVAVKEGLRQPTEIAVILGADLVTIGPSDLSLALGITDPPNLLFRSTIEGIAATLGRVGNPKMACPLGNAS